MRVYRDINEVRGELVRKQQQCLDAQLRYERIVTMFSMGMTANEIAKEMRIKTTKTLAKAAAVQQASMKYAYEDAARMIDEIEGAKVEAFVAEPEPEYVAVAQWTQARIEKGETIKDFRGIEWTFDRVSRIPEGNSEGRVLVTDEFGRNREFFPSVFNLRIVTTTKENAR